MAVDEEPDEVGVNMRPEKRKTMTADNFLFTTMWISHNYTLDLVFSTLSYIAFSNDMIIFPTFSSSGGFTWPPYKPQIPASRSMNYNGQSAST